MGLLDVLNGMQNGPRGPKTPDASSGGGMSPMTMAILALLAYKAVKHVTGSSSPASAGPASTPAGGQQHIPPATTTASQAGSPAGGGLGGLLQGNLGGVLGGLLAGGAAGSVLSGGLNDLLKQFQEAGQGDTANSWVSPGSNKQIAPSDLESALGADQIHTLTSQTGLSRSELLEGLARQLPEVIDQLTPEGRVPTEHEASRWL
ncbi:MAG: YidB family protein [Xanthobacteraceae bacterium]|nr:YidB family protein [Xanthobacteraceae bacterium]